MKMKIALLLTVAVGLAWAQGAPLTPTYEATPDTGSLNAASVSLASCPGYIPDGMQVTFLPAFSNTSTAPTLTVCGVSATITKNGGNALVSSDYASGTLATVRYNLPSTRWELQNPLTVSASGLSSVGLSTTAAWFTVGNSPLVANGTLTFNPASGLTQNEFLATPNGSSGAVGLRAIVASDVPTLNQSTTGTAGGLSGTPSITVNGITATTYNGGAFSGTFTGAPTFSGNIDFTGTPTFSNTLAVNTSGTAGALGSAPTTCSSGSAPQGILANGNATGCTSITSGGVAPGNVSYLTSDATGSTSNTLAATSITFSMAASTNYTLECHLLQQPSATSAVGFTFGVTGPGTPTEVTLAMLNQTTQTAMRSEYSRTATWGAKLGATATTYDTNPVPVTVFGLVQNVTSGTLTIEYANIGTTGTETLKAGSWCRLQ